MAKRIMTRPGGPLGVSPTSSQKLIHVSNKLGLPGIQGMQGSTLNIFDTVVLSANAGRQTLSFFSQTSNKSRNFTNFQNGSLNAGETLTCEFIAFRVLSLSGTNLTLDSTTINRDFRLSEFGSEYDLVVTPTAALRSAIVNVSIANQRVVRDFLINETDPNFNPRTNGIAFAGTRAVTAGSQLDTFGPYGQNAIPLEAAPVLPPNQKIEVTFEIPPISAIGSNPAVQCIIGRFGSIFASKTTL